MLPTLISDFVTAWTGIPTESGVAIWNRYRERKARELRDEWFREIGAGRALPFEAASEDDKIDIVVRLLGAMDSGTARFNLRLMLRVLKGLGERGPVYVDEFARYQKIVADLGWEEVAFLATYYREYVRGKRELKEELALEAWKRTKQTLVGSTFKSDGHFEAIAHSLQRTGLVLPGQTIDEAGIVVPTPLLEDVINLAKLEDLESWKPR